MPALLQQVVDGAVGPVGRDGAGAPGGRGGHRAAGAARPSGKSVGAFTEDDLLQTVEQAVEAHLLEAGDDGAEVAFAHALVREVLYEGILPPRRRVWHRRVAEVLAEAPGADPDAVADHFQPGPATRGRPTGWSGRGSGRFAPTPG